MKKLEIVGLNEPLEIPEHIVLDESKKAVLIQGKVKQAATAESDYYKGGENRVSIVFEKEFKNSENKMQRSFSKNGLRLADAITRDYEELGYEMSETYDEHDKPVFSYNAIDPLKARLFNSILHGSIITVVSVPIKADSPMWDNEAEPYKEDVVHYEIISIAIPDESKAVERFIEARKRYEKTLARKAAIEAAAEANQPLPEL